MKRNSLQYPARAFTLVEIMVALVLLMVVGTIVYAVMMSFSTLLAKDISLNESNTTTRKALDRIFAEITQANGLPILINADGTRADGTTPAAGILYDLYVGGPYIVGNPGSGLPATTKTLQLYYSTDPSANPPAPVRNDVVLMDGVTRALVDSTSAPSSYGAPLPSPTPITGKMRTVTLQGTLGSYRTPQITSGIAIAWTPPIQQAAYVVHRNALVVVPPSSVAPINGIYPAAQLRLYRDAEAITDYSDPANYVVLTGEIGTKPRSNSPYESGTDPKIEARPFWIYASNSANFLSVALRVDGQRYNKRLATQQANEATTFLRVDTLLRPRNFMQ